MKRLSAMILCLIMALSLCACDVNPGQTDGAPKFTEPEPVTLADGSVVYSKEPFVDFPQTGEYKETALLTNVPGQGVPLLLDMREDGTIDYIFADVEEKADFQTFSDSGAAYYTIAPDGTATRQNSKWMEELDNYLRQVVEAAEEPNAVWSFQFAAEDGNLLILARYRKNRIYLLTTLFKVIDGQITIVPINWNASGEFALDKENITAVDLVNGYVAISQVTYPHRSEQEPISVYHTNGTLTDLKYYQSSSANRFVYISANGTLLFSDDPKLNSADHRRFLRFSADTDFPLSYYSESFYTDLVTVDDKLLYYFGTNFPIHAAAYGPDRSFCYWYNRVGQGVLMRYDHHPEGISTDSEILTVWAMAPYEPLVQAIAMWNHAHASPVIRLETVQDEIENSNLTRDDILGRLNLELLNNQGPDVLILDGLNVDRYLEFMAPLDQVNTDGIYPSILERFTVNGDLLALPSRVVPYLLGRAADGTQQIESLEQFADIITASTEVLNLSDYFESPHRYTSAMYNIFDYTQLFALWYPAWQDTIWEGGKLNRDVFTEFLTQLQRLSDHYTLPMVEEAGYYSPYSNEDVDNAVKRRPAFPYTLNAGLHVGMYSYWWTNRTEAVPCYINAIPGPDGTGVMTPWLIAGVRAGGNEEAGQEFIQLLQSREAQFGYAYQRVISNYHLSEHPVKWTATEELLHRAEEIIGMEFPIRNDYEEMINGLQTVIVDDFLFSATLSAFKQCYQVTDPLILEEIMAGLEESTRIYLAELR